MNARRSTTRGCRSLGRTGLGVLLSLALGLGGCASSAPHTQLPELAKDPRPVLTPDQQNAAASDLAAQRAARRDSALKEIEQKR